MNATGILQLRDEASKQRKPRAIKLWKALYVELSNKNLDTDPEWITFEFYRRIVARGEKVIPIWQTDSPDEVLKKIDDCLNDRLTVQKLSEAEKGVINVLISSLKEMTLKVIDAHYAILELYLKVRTYEHPEKCKKGFILSKATASDPNKLDEQLKHLFGKSLSELRQPIDLGKIILHP